MRVAMAVLADAVNMREGMLNVLSAGVSRLTREEFPGELGVDLALMIELAPEDVVRPGSVELRVKLIDPQGTDVFDVNGNLEWGQSVDIETSTYMSVPITFRNAVIPTSGKYQFQISIGNLDDIMINVNAVKVAPNDIAI